MHKTYEITRANPLLDKGFEVIPLLIDERLVEGQKFELNGICVCFYKANMVRFFEDNVFPLLVKDALNLLDFNSLDLSDINILKSYGLGESIGDILCLEQTINVNWDVKILEIRIEKASVRDDFFYIEGWVLDPLKRLWQICPGEYCEGWFMINQGFEDMGIRYSKLNDIKLNSLIR